MAIADLLTAPSAQQRPKEASGGAGHWPGVDFTGIERAARRWTHCRVEPSDELDNSAPDRRPADGRPRPYTDFCTFMTVMHGHIKIK
jgi:hypothetical protein